MQTVGAETISEVVVFLQNINALALPFVKRKALPLQAKQNRHFLSESFQVMIRENVLQHDRSIWVTVGKKSPILGLKNICSLTVLSRDGLCNIFQ